MVAAGSSSALDGSSSERNGPGPCRHAEASSPGWHPGAMPAPPLETRWTLAGCGCCPRNSRFYLGSRNFLQSSVQGIDLWAPLGSGIGSSSSAIYRGTSLFMATGTINRPRRFQAATTEPAPASAGLSAIDRPSGDQTRVVDSSNSVSRPLIACWRRLFAWRLRG